MGQESRGDERPLTFGRLFQLFEPLNQIDAAFSFPFLDIKVTFEIVVLGIFGDFSKGAQPKRDNPVLGPMKEFAATSKTTMGSSEIYPVEIARVIEIRQAVNARSVKMGNVLNSPARESEKSALSPKIAPVKVAE
jgi:hypothetical protein